RCRKPHRAKRKEKSMSEQNQMAKAAPQEAGLDMRRRELVKLTAAGVAAIGAASFFNIPTAEAQDMPQGADNFYKSDRVTLEKVTFRTQYGKNVVGNLLIPDDIDRNASHPALVVGHPMGAVKEQSATLYATKMAEQGFVAMAIDLPYWGESG